MTEHEAYWLGFEKGRNSMKADDNAVEANRQSLLDRSNVGIAKYGTTLTDNKGDLRYWLNHALEECLDQANYLKRAIMEIDKNNCSHNEHWVNSDLTESTCINCGKVFDYGK